LRDLLGGLEKEHPHLKETLLSAMGNIETGRLLDPKYLDLDGGPAGRVDEEIGGVEKNPLVVLSND
jgi:hypothetical protein